MCPFCRLTQWLHRVVCWPVRCEICNCQIWFNRYAPVCMQCAPEWLAQFGAKPEEDEMIPF